MNISTFSCNVKNLTMKSKSQVQVPYKPGPSQYMSAIAEFLPESASGKCILNLLIRFLGTTPATLRASETCDMLSQIDGYW